MKSSVVVLPSNEWSGSRQQLENLCFILVELVESPNFTTFDEKGKFKSLRVLQVFPSFCETSQNIITINISPGPSHWKWLVTPRILSHRFPTSTIPSLIIPAAAKRKDWKMSDDTPSKAMMVMLAPDGYYTYLNIPKPRPGADNQAGEDEEFLNVVKKNFRKLSIRVRILRWV